MHGSMRLLHNTARIEAWPADLLRARGNPHARVLAGAQWVLRRKRDGRYLAASGREGLVPLLPRWWRESGTAQALDALAAAAAEPDPARGNRVPAVLALDDIAARLQVLQIDADAYAARSGLALVPEPAWLAHAGADRHRRPLWLHVHAARAWLRMREAARRDGVVLEAVSGYRSHDYQLGIVQRKLARGLAIGDILKVNAAPGFSEHHSGLALDISTPGEPSAEASFADTPAFAWLQAHAAAHRFVMSYPRDNPHGIVYEPWHWCYQPA